MHLFSAFLYSHRKGNFSMTNIPEQVKTALKTLSDAGFEAYIVGGCVRDYLLGRIPNDYDITTNALPEQTRSLFGRYKCIDVGIQHGTVAVIIDKMQLEITTYRIDGEYSDKRHPESVTFSSDLKDDLSRRDFTVNALACDSSGCIVDCFDGRGDIERQIIRCVGEAEKRFDEDALRIMRAVRFASQLGFSIASETEKQIFALKDTLKMISAERLRAELDKLICGRSACDILTKYHEIPGVFIPEILKITEYDRARSSDAWNRTAKSVTAAPKDIPVRLALLFHDIAVPECLTTEPDKTGRFTEHSEKGAQMAGVILKRLKYDNKTLKAVTTLVKYHDVRMNTRRDIKHVMSEIGTELFFRLLDMQRALESAAAHSFGNLQYIQETADSIIDGNECLSVKELCIDGSSLMKAGFKGSEIGNALNAVLNAVLDGELENSSDRLLEFAVKNRK